tara:strand:+ start:88 stop:333 length:246 start_codon:yes stop_codon:yes gene_type:complete
MLDSLKGSNMRDVYIVNGSEDGLIGVYSSLKKGKYVALDYATQQGAETAHMSDLSSDDHGIWFFHRDDENVTATVTREEVQ